MRKPLLPGDTFAAAFAIGLVVVAAAVGGVLLMQRGAQLNLPGRIVRVRTLDSSPTSSLALIDIEFTNTSDYMLVVRQVAVTLENAQGEMFDGAVASAGDAKRVFDVSGSLGSFEPPLGGGAKILPHSNERHTLVAQFSGPEDVLKSRKRFVVRIDEVDGKSFEYAER